jgi:DeoR/GlpR family transcriptional regulator of sugar metabolism
MLPIARKSKIKELIIEKKSVTVAELTNLFNVTEETVRRDLKQLEDEGYLSRTYGGAFISDGVQNDVNVNIREYIHVEGKKKIASKCLSFIKNGDSIFLDASTTSLVIATMLQDKKLTVVTNSMKVVNVLAESANNIVVIGGTLAKTSLSNLGRNAEFNMKNYFFDSAFISCRSVSMHHGITDSNEQQAGIRRLAAEHANHVYLVADYTKFDKTSFASICWFDQINHLVVDKELSEEWHSFLKEQEVIAYECE